jgi:hypothetical protein
MLNGSGDGWQQAAMPTVGVEMADDGAMAGNRWW